MDPFALPAFLATGALAGLLAGLLGIGGGALIVPALIAIFAYLPLATAWAPHQAVATSLATIVATGSASAYAHHRRGAVRWPVFRVLAPALLLGGAAGALASGLIAPWWLQRLFALFLLYMGARMLLRRPDARAAAAALAPGRAMAAVGAAFGAVSALLGIGGGVLVVPYLARRGLAMQQAVATASACGVPIALAGSLGFVAAGWERPGLPAGSLGFVYWPAALAILCASVPMAALGARLAHRLPTAALKRLFGAFLLLAAGELLIG